jgi:hypothetical protein
MSGRPDDWVEGSRRVGQADGRRTRRSDGRHARPRRSEAEDAPELRLPDPDDDDPTTLAEDAEWAAKLRPGRAPTSGELGPVTSETAADSSQAPPTRDTGAAWDDAASSSGSWDAPASSSGSWDDAASSSGSWDAPASSSGSWEMSTEPATGGPWNTAPSDGTGDLWAASPSETTADPWAPSSSAAPPATDPWTSSPNIGESSTGDWSPGIAAAGREPGRRLSDQRYGRPPAPGAGAGHDPWGSGGLKSEAGTQETGGHAEPSGSPPGNRDTGSWGLDPDATGGWQPETAWSPEPAAHPWEDPPATTTPEPPYRATPTPEPPSAGPWEPPLPRRPTPATPAPPASTEPDFGSIFSDLAQDRQEEAPGRHGPAVPDAELQNEDPAVRAAHLEARRLIEHATGQLFQSDPTMLWEQEEPLTRADEVTEPAANFGTASPGGLPRTEGAGGVGGYGLSPGPGVGHGTPGSSGSPGTSTGWSDPLPPPPIPDASTPYGPATSFAPPGSAPADLGGAAPPAQTPGRALSPAYGREWSADDGDGSGSGLWAPDRRADEDDSAGVGWLWSVEDHGASPQVPRSWVREMPTTQTHDLDGLARPIESRRQRQLESRGHGRRVRSAKRWPVVLAVAAWVVLFAVVCWLYIFPWLEGILPENF